MPEVNPFQPPPTDRPLDNPVDGPPAKSGRPLLGWWICFAVNLPVCLFLGWIHGGSIGGGVFGMVTGVIVFGFAGALAHRPWPGVMKLVTSGGWAVAAFQLMPLPQFWSGMVATLIAMTLFGGARNLNGTFLAAEAYTFVCVLLTGMFLALAAFIVGLLIRLLSGGGVRDAAGPRTRES